jgi:hypothetical protein
MDVTVSSRMISGGFRVGSHHTFTQFVTLKVTEHLPGSNTGFMTKR